MEVTINMQEEEQVTQDSNAQGVQDRRLRRLQSAVTCCVLGLCILAAITIYLMVCSIIQKRENQVLTQTIHDTALEYKTEGVNLNNEGKPRAHLTGTRQDHSIPQNQVLQWEDHRGLAFTKYGMNYRKPSLQIPKTGYYFIYSQVSFQSSGSVCEHKTDQTKYVSQTITRVNDNYPEAEVLLSGITPLCKMESEGYRPIYVAALLYMTEGDQVMVNVSDIKLVDVTAEHRTFFGAFLV